MVPPARQAWAATTTQPAQQQLLPQLPASTLQDWPLWLSALQRSASDPSYCQQQTNWAQHHHLLQLQPPPLLLLLTETRQVMLHCLSLPWFLPFCWLPLLLLWLPWPWLALVQTPHRPSASCGSHCRQHQHQHQCLLLLLLLLMEFAAACPCCHGHWLPCCPCPCCYPYRRPCHAFCRCCHQLLPHPPHKQQQQRWRRLCCWLCSCCCALLQLRVAGQLLLLLVWWLVCFCRAPTHQVLLA